MLLKIVKNNLKKSGGRLGIRGYFESDGIGGEINLQQTIKFCYDYKGNILNYDNPENVEYQSKKKNQLEGNFEVSMKKEFGEIKITSMALDQRDKSIWNKMILYLTMWRYNNF